MNDKPQAVLSRTKELLGRHRRKLVAAGTVIVVYALLGFLLVPWLVEKLAVDTVREQYAAELTIEKVAFNPFVLGLRIDGLAMNDPDGAPFVTARQIYANLQLSSIFRLAPTFREIRLDGPEARLARFPGGTLNAGFLAQPAEAGSAPGPGAASSELPRLVIHQFVVNEAALHWRDEVPPEPVVTTFGPVNVVVENLNTLPGREGQQQVVITTETAGTLSWGGSLQLNPLRSAGHAELQGSHMPLTSAYIRHEVGFELVEGLADIGFDYAVDTLDDGRIQATVDDFTLGLTDVLVRTYGVTAPSGEPADLDVLAIPALRVLGGALRWPEQSIALDEVLVTGAELSIHRAADGSLDIIPATGDTEAAAEPNPSGAGGEWSVSLSRFGIEGLSIGLIDESVTPRADLGVEDLTLNVTGISSAPGSRFPIEASIVTRGGGTARIGGSVGVLPDPVAELSLSASGLALSETHPYLKPLADVNLDSGALGIEAQLSSGPDDPMKVTGDIFVTNFLITETDEGSRLGSWDRLGLENIAASLGNRTIQISEVRLEKPYADVFVAEDGAVNLGRIEPGTQTAEDDTEDAVDEPDDSGEGQADGNSEPPFDVTIGRVTIADAAADFADFSLPLPFEASIAELNGSLTTIATASAEPSEVSMEGKVDEFGLFRASGTLTPLEIARNTNIRLDFQNVEMPKFSAYTVAFAGRAIASGKLDLELGYKMQDSQLVGENRVVLRDFELGDKVEHPGAMSLPLGLAVALLKGPDGTIDIDLPVRGDVNDPEFGYGRVIGRALVNLIVKIVASPFALLGKLIGVEADELDHVLFIAGRSDLTPPMQERVAKLAEALAQRPELVLVVNGVVDREVDGLAIRTARFDELVDSRIETSGESEAMYAALRVEAVEDLYGEADTTGGAAADELRTRFTSESADPETGRTTTTFDALAYTAELRRQLIERQSVTEQEFVGLARGRAGIVRSALVAIDATLEGRVRSDQLEATEADESGNVRMDVVLTTGDER